ncbi:MAG TPA: hypothetical protein VIV84_10190 [Burkholderiaceae bacterium]
MKQDKLEPSKRTAAGSKSTDKRSVEPPDARDDGTIAPHGGTTGNRARYSGDRSKTIATPGGGSKGKQ